jgi:hypothetical protein
MTIRKSVSNGKSGTFVLLSKDTRFLNYHNADRDGTKRDMGIEIVEEQEEQDETEQSTKIFNKPKVREAAYLKTAETMELMTISI